MAIQFPDVDPVALHLGPLQIRWYALAYISGLLLGWQLLRRLVIKPPFAAWPEDVDDFLTYATFGVILGGRLGYVVFYQPQYFLAHPLQILEVWQGGMSFHGGFLGVATATILFAHQRNIAFQSPADRIARAAPMAQRKMALWRFADRIAVVAPIGLCLGRIANFINGELWGRVAPATLPWAMIFPRADNLPRHPSQLYQAGMEGVVLFLILWTAARCEKIRARTGMLTGIFLAGYGTARYIGEFFREPDSFLGFLWAGATMGQILSAPMIMAGVFLILRARPDPWDNAAA
jgi:phosphatidylglycerol:prolipoprotein diacylglycerol transferase